ncbi:MAG: hypothetical protein SLAVMIC_00549 [uncultured marine phage]|uniref:Uncharacterized protein n=1 Tax=uncultured marine phage TaxID=707152 RepID=A0A8D9C938_9VIRU|nr:MAG: hypothetical protein SLAVMIC_00549 [uncultured marine phage]
MTREQFIKRAIQQNENLYTDYYYFGWDYYEDEVKKYRTFLIGDVHQIDGGNQSPYGHISHKKTLFTDENGEEIERFFGFEANVNVNVEIFEYYKISGEVQGTTVMMKLLSSFNKVDPNPIYQKKDVYLEGNFTSRYLAADMMFDRFWEDNKDWLKDIYIPSISMVF